MSEQQKEWEAEGFKAFSTGGKQPNMGFGARAYYWRRGYYDASILAEKDKDDGERKSKSRGKSV